MQHFKVFSLAVIVTVFLVIWRVSLLYRPHLDSWHGLQESNQNNVDDGQILHFKAHSLPHIPLKVIQVSPQNLEITELVVWGKSRATVINMSVYEENDHISNQIRRWRSWEEGAVKLLLTYLKLHKDLHFLDIGSNLGVYSLNVASLRPDKRLVVAVDANKRNCERLYYSLQLNGWTKQVLVVNNALDEERGEGVVKIPVGNIGGAAMMSHVSLKLRYQNSNEASPSVKMQRVYFDDLLNVIPFKAAVMKMDIEFAETRALRRAAQLFKSVTIPVVLMEWTSGYHEKRTYQEYVELMHFFYSRNYEAYTELSANRRLLTADEFYSWPQDIVWILKDYPHF